MIKNVGDFLQRAQKHTVSAKAIVASILIASAGGALAHDIDDPQLHAFNGKSIVEMMSQSSLDFLADRPIAKSYVPGVPDTRMLEVNEPSMFLDEAKAYNTYATYLGIQSMYLPVPGYAIALDPEITGLNERLCMIAHEQPSDRLHQDFYIDPTRNIPSLMPRNYADFFIKSHEAIHCSFYYQRPDESVEINEIYTSLSEVAADLGAIIDYMRITGDDNIYDDFVRPLRMGNLADHSHKTAWALDEILKDVSPSAMRKKDRQDIPDIVASLMQEHMLDEDGKSLDMSKKASQMMVAEINAGKDITSKTINLSDEKTIDKLKKDSVNTVFRQIVRYKESSRSDDPKVFQHHFENLMGSIDSYDLPMPKSVFRPRVKNLEKSISRHSYAEHYLGR